MGGMDDETRAGEDESVESPAETSLTEPVSEEAHAPSATLLSLRRQPVWTYFLTPIAVLIGAVIIAGTIWYLDDDNGEGYVSVDGVGGQSMVPAQGAPASDPAAAQDLLATFNGYARQIGIDQAKFQQCLSKQENVQLITSHLQRGTQLGVNGTPTFFINNKKLVGAQPAAIFDEIIAAELKGSPTTLDGYSAAVKALASSSPPRFEILPEKIDLSGAAIEGNVNAKVVIAEFSDFQCPFCKRWTDDYLKRARGQVAGGDVALAFLHFPITQIHANAGNASVAAICAGEQGKFWQMHDLLFAHQDEWAKAKN